MTIAGGSSLKVTQEVIMPDSVVAMNIFYFVADFAVDQYETAIVNNSKLWIEALYGSLVDEMSDLLTLGTMTVYGYNSITDLWDNKGTHAPSVTFTGESEMLPHGVAALVRAYSTDSRAIARKYLPGFVEVAQADGVWVSSVLAALADFLDLWGTVQEISTGNELVPAVWSVAQSRTFELTGTGVILSEPAYQRRRRPGVGS